MNQFILLGLLSPLLWAITNYIDKGLLHKISYPTKHIIPVLMIFSGIIGIVPILVFGTLSIEQLFSTEGLSMIVLIFTGIIYMAGVYLYLFALNTDSPTNVIPYFQFMPLFALIIGFFFFGEIIVGYNLLGCILIVVGAILLSINLETYHFNSKVLVTMAISSLLFTVADALFKGVYLGTSFSFSVFGTSVGITIVGLGLLLVKKYRIGFIQTIKVNGKKLLFLNSINEILNITAKLIFFYISAFIFLAHLELLNSLQPLFIILIGFILYKFYPKLFGDYRSAKEFPKQIISILVMIVGVFMITI